MHRTECRDAIASKYEKYIIHYFITTILGGCEVGGQ